jgi:hypothetical protein
MPSRKTVFSNSRAFVKILRQSRRECKLSPLEGPVMVNVRSDSVPVSVDAVINSLTIQGIAFRGPFCTPGQRTVFVVQNHILLQSELFELLAQNKLDRDGIQEFAKRIQPRENHD